MAEELVAVVNDENTLIRFGGKRTIGLRENTSVVLILIYDPSEKILFLFNRGAGASDMKDHWSLTAGKINQSDFSDHVGHVGRVVPDSVIRKAASRELYEELRINIDNRNLKNIATFCMKDKSLVFSLLALVVDHTLIEQLVVDGAEVDNYRSFTLSEFATNTHLGDAIKYRKAQITEFLENEFSSRV
jgi:8-oxo-dGTP pyrophosphatase MutT (NUDIX family)